MEENEEDQYESTMFHELIRPILQQIRKYFLNIESIPELYISTLLDPRFKNKWYHFRDQDSDKSKEREEKLNYIMEEYIKTLY